MLGQGLWELQIWAEAHELEEPCRYVVLIENEEQLVGGGFELVSDKGQFVKELV